MLLGEEDEVKVKKMNRYYNLFQYSGVIMEGRKGTTRRQVVLLRSGHESPVNLGCEETRLRGERVQTIVVFLKLKD